MVRQLGRLADEEGMDDGELWPRREDSGGHLSVRGKRLDGDELQFFLGLEEQRRGDANSSSYELLCPKNKQSNN